MFGPVRWLGRKGVVGGEEEEEGERVVGSVSFEEDLKGSNSGERGWRSVREKATS